MSQKKRGSPSSTPAGKRADTSAQAALRAWTRCQTEHDKVRQAVARLPGADAVLAAMDALLVQNQEQVLRDHALPHTETDTNTECWCGSGRPVIYGARCRRCWDDTVIRPGCVLHQWCDMCECPGQIDKDDLRIKQHRKECPQCTNEEACSDCEQWEEDVHDEYLRREWGGHGRYDASYWD